jgi:hypothetical protein
MTIQMSVCSMPLQQLPDQPFYGFMFRQHETPQFYLFPLKSSRSITLGSAAISGRRGSLHAIADNGSRPKLFRN